MAHDITDRRMVYTGETPWHTAGNPIAGLFTFAQADAVCRFPIAVERQVFAAGVPTAIPDRKALVESRSGAYLATVGIDYGVVQPQEVYDAITGAMGTVEGRLETAGVLGATGATFWMMGRLPETIRVKGEDTIEPFFLAYAGHDGRTPVTIANIATRVVCRNTLGAALREKGGFRTSIRHTSNAAAYVQSAAAGFRTLRASFNKLGQWANLAADRKLTTPEAIDIMKALHPNTAEAGTAAADRITAVHEAILTGYERHEFASTRGTAWALFNATQAYAEHMAPTRAKLQLSAMTQTARASLIAERSFFGAGADGGQDALNAVLAATGLPHPSAMKVAA